CHEERRRMRFGESAAPTPMPVAPSTRPRRVRRERRERESEIGGVISANLYRIRGGCQCKRAESRQPAFPIRDNAEGWRVGRGAGLELRGQMEDCEIGF